MEQQELKLLLVEDNPGDADLLRHGLRKSGSAFSVKHVERLQQAAEEVKREHFDLMLLDLSLPDSQGVRTVKRAHEFAPDLAIVVLTGLDHERAGIEAVRAGAQDYLIKGEATGKTLVRAIRYAVERKTMQTERENLIKALEQALTTVKTLSGLLPICASCKKIRDDKGYWSQVEEYLDEHADVKFTHSMCPQCTHKLYPEYFDKNGAERE